VGEHVIVVPRIRPLHGGSNFDVAIESIIKYFLDICVVSTQLTVRIEICVHGMFQADEDGCVIFIYMQNTECLRTE
jgi:hypothetical protein